MTKIDEIGIVGLGLIGGSLAKAIKKSQICNKVIAYDKSIDSLKQALEDRVIDEIAYEVDNTFGCCDIIFICIPVSHIGGTIKKLNSLVKSECILTDVGSTKSGILSELKEYPMKCTYIGGHPMAGSERDGYKSAKYYLFENAYYVLVPDKSTESAKLELLKEVVTAIGALPVIIDSEKHDYATAAISHVPHVLASALVNMVKASDTDNGYMHMLAAGGFKDITRIAGSSPKVWESICLSNKEKILKIIQTYEDIIADFKRALLQGDSRNIGEFFETAREYRSTFSDKALGPILKSYEVIVSVADEPGIIASIAGLLSSNSINIKNIGIINSREMEEGVLEISFYDEESRKRCLEIVTKNGYQAFSK